MRRWNPLGFKVIELTSEPEVLPQPAAAGRVRTWPRFLRPVSACAPRVLLRALRGALPPFECPGPPPCPSGARSTCRIRLARYAADEVYRLRGFVGYQIDLEFEAGESFVGLGAGDLESLTFAAQANHLFLKPRAAGVDTNLTVLTSAARTTSTTA